MHIVPKQMRYQAALLPDGGFPRGCPPATQPAFGTKRNRAAHCGTLAPHSPPHGNRAGMTRQRHPALTKTKDEFVMAEQLLDVINPNEQRPQKADAPRYTYARTHTVGGRAKTYWRFRRAGTDVPLLGSPGTAAFDKQYQAMMHRHENERAQKFTPDTFAWLARAFLSSPNCEALALKTQAAYFRMIDKKLIPALGGMNFNTIKRAHLDAAIGVGLTARVVEQHRLLVSRIYSWADAEGILDRDVANPGYEPRAAKGRGKALAYFISSETGAIKIGVAHNVKARLATLQACCPVKLTISATAPGGIATERAYHHKFKDHRLHGEWFRPHPVILAEIERLVSADAPATQPSSAKSASFPATQSRRVAGVGAE